jgi:Holliday junction resolvase RusA-like endonuclease
MIEWTGKAISANRRLAVGKGRVYSEPQYQRFIDSMAWTIKAKALSRTFQGKIRVDLEFDIPARMDVDALVKPCWDAVQRSGLVKDDNQISMGSQQRTGIAAASSSRILFLIRQLRAGGV